jgi:hypothetical protein
MGRLKPVFEVFALDDPAPAAAFGFHLFYPGYVAEKGNEYEQSRIEYIIGAVVDQPGDEGETEHPYTLAEGRKLCDK